MINPEGVFGFEFIQAFTIILIAALVVAALVSIYRTRSMRGTEAAIWVAVVILAPVVGPIVWFLLRGRRGNDAERLPESGSEH